VLLRLRAVPGLHISENAPLAGLTRFGIGGPARWLIDAATVEALTQSLKILRETRTPHAVIGGGSNLIASDAGFSGAVVRYTDASLDIPSAHTGASSVRPGSLPANETTRVRAAAGATLQDVVDRTISSGLRGLETLTGIPGWVGGAIYGNAGAYGHSIHERVRGVRILDGLEVRALDNAECEFRYRDSVFKRHKEWIVLSVDLELDPGDAEDLRGKAAAIRKIRDEKYPPSMRCAGSIFKNLIFAELAETARTEIPEKVIREGKVPSAYFLEQVGAKGMVRGGVKVAGYHANLIYNEGGGTARELRELIATLKERVHERFGVTLEEEVQYV
jgi:UDP-N-acetylmuramate dehydrogenase